MPLIDLPLADLQAYRPPLTRPADFDQFWQRTLREAATQPLNVVFTPLDYPARGLRIERVTYDGWRGARIAGLLLAPEGPGPYPALVFFHGYSGSKGTPYDYLGWAYQGYAILAVDVRGQNGESEDNTVYPGGHVTGWLTQGILDPERYYYRGVYVDCLRALEVVAGRPEVDAGRIGVTGISQGGGLTLAVAALDPRPKVAMADIPFLCHFRRAVEVTDQRPYSEIIEYLRTHPGQEEAVFHTLSYFDVLNLADRITCPTLISVGLLDLICPPSTIFAVYNHLRCPKDLAIYPYGVHAVPASHWERKLRWAQRSLQGG